MKRWYNRQWTIFDKAAKRSSFFHLALDWAAIIERPIGQRDNQVIKEKMKVNEMPPKLAKWVACRTKCTIIGGGQNCGWWTLEENTQRMSSTLGVGGGRHWSLTSRSLLHWAIASCHAAIALPSSPFPERIIATQPFAANSIQSPSHPFHFLLLLLRLSFSTGDSTSRHSPSASLQITRIATSDTHTRNSFSMFQTLHFGRTCTHLCFERRERQSYNWMKWNIRMKHRSEPVSVTAHCHCSGDGSTSQRQHNDPIHSTSLSDQRSPTKPNPKASPTNWPTLHRPFLCRWSLN